MASDGRYPVPPGFRPLLEALARDVLRSQPKDIYDYSFHFFENMMIFKKENGVYPVLDDPAMYSQFKKLFHKQKIPTVQVNSGAPGTAGESKDTVQCRESDPNRIRGNEVEEHEADRKNQVSGDEKDLEKAATKIQAAFRGFQVRLMPERFGMNKSRRRSTEPEYDYPPRDLDLAGGKTVRSSSLGPELYSPEEEHAATKIQDRVEHNINAIAIGWEFTRTSNSTTILQNYYPPEIQAGIRGFLTRKDVRRKVSSEKNAATKIQSRFSGFTPRSRLRLAFEASVKFVNAGLEKARIKRKDSLNSEVEEPVVINEDKGYMTRKQLEEQGLLSPSRSSASSRGAGTLEEGEGGEADAATKIQANVRGFLTRKELVKEKEAAKCIQHAFRDHREQVKQDMHTDQNYNI